MNSFPPVTPIVCRHRNGEAKDPGAPCQGPLQTAHLLHLATSGLLVLTYLDMTMSFVMRSHALISNLYSSFGFLWGPSPHPCLVFLWRPFRPHFHFLNVEYYITALGCFMVLFLKRPAGRNQSPSSHWFLRSCCILSLLDVFS